jgi:hypothetical protein
MSEEELSGLSVKDLRSRAAAAGVSEDAIEDARDGDDPKKDLIALILAAQTGSQMSAEELSGLSVKDLRSRAAAAGVSEDAIEDARDGDDPKKDLIALILATQSNPLAEMLAALPMKDLRSRAAAAGVNEDAIEEARDGSQPKEDLIALISGVISTLEAQLATLSVKDLRVRATGAGVSEDTIEDARDGDDPKHDLIALILAQYGQGKPGMAQTGGAFDQLPGAVPSSPAALAPAAKHHLPTQIPVAPVAPVAPASPTAPTTTKKQISETVDITCPSGATPGTEMQVTTYSGKKVNVTIPEGVRPGQVFKLDVRTDATEHDEEEDEKPVKTTGGIPNWVFLMWLAYMVHTGVMVGLSTALGSDGRRRLAAEDGNIKIPSLDINDTTLAIENFSHYAEPKAQKASGTSSHYAESEAERAARRRTQYYSSYSSYSSYSYSYSSGYGYGSYSSYSSGYSYGGGGIDAGMLMGAFVTGPAIHVILIPTFMIIKYRHSKQQTDRSKRGSGAFVTELDEASTSVVFNIKFTLGQKIFIFFLGNLIDLGTFVIKLAEIVGLDLTNFWFPMPFFEFFKAKCQVGNYRIKGAKVRLNASQADAYFHFLSESLWNFCASHRPQCKQPLNIH